MSALRAIPALPFFSISGLLWCVCKKNLAHAKEALICIRINGTIHFSLHLLFIDHFLYYLKTSMFYVQEIF